MSTRAQRYKAESVRTRKPPLGKRPRTVTRNDATDTSLLDVSATDRRVGTGRTAERTRSRRAGRKATVELETSVTARPSRKSTRKAKNRAKPDSNLRRRQTRRTTAPKTRARRAAAAKR